MDLARHLSILERELLSPATRGNPARLTELLSPTFSEFGSSGRILNLATTLSSLNLESTIPQPTLTLSDFTLLASTETWALVTYRSQRRDETGRILRSSLRSSTWVFRQGRWQMLFHQGTREPTPSPSAQAPASGRVPKQLPALPCDPDDRPRDENFTPPHSPCEHPGRSIRDFL